MRMLRYWRDLDFACRRLADLDPQVASTPAGPVQYVAGGQFPIQFPSTGDVVRDSQACADAGTTATVSLPLRLAPSVVLPAVSPAVTPVVAPAVPR